ncbi:MAG: transglutaminaseTgpA domain-containing protein, partial [Cyanobacteria bacterium P01_A01_bin.135]
LIQPRPIQPEHSLRLRLYVQALVSVGIIATDVTSADAADALGISFWAVPLGVVGALWSWRTRHRPRRYVQGAIAVGMVAALVVFLSEIATGQADTRLALAALLIHLQVLHSFDLPRRKDLGYSIVIGLILMGVAATLSQTLVFAPLLLLFMALALPSLALDYRSRLGLPPLKPSFTTGQLPLRQWVLLFAAAAGAGLIIFAGLPRLGSYQIRSLPVSAAIDFTGSFDGQTITNPAYDGNGGDGDGDGDGSLGNGSGAPGTVDEFAYYGFNSRMNQNLRGEMTPQVVMRVRAQAPGFWRVLAFERYTGWGWDATYSQEEMTVLSRPRWMLQFYLPGKPSSLPSREVVQTYSIAADFPNLVPALYQPSQLYFPLDQVAVDAGGSLRSPIALSGGITYTVVSQVPQRDRTQLSQTDTDYPPGIRQRYLQVPEEILPAVRELTDEILAEAPNPLTHPYEQALYLAQHLKQTYQLQQDLPFFEAGDDLVSRFLFDYGGGQPDHFSTVLTIMLRSIGVPARLVTGFAPGDFNPFTGLYVVRNTDAYAITEVYFGEAGWFSFDPIPGHELIPPAPQEAEAFGLLRQFWRWVAGGLPPPILGWIRGSGELLMAMVSRAVGLMGQLLSGGVIQKAIALAGLGLGLWLAWMGGKGLWGWWRLRQLPPVEAIYQRMLVWAGDRGVPKRPYQTPLEHTALLKEQL